MRTLMASVLVAHGLLRLMGFAKAFGSAGLSQLTLPISKSVALLCLLTTVLLLVAAGTMCRGCHAVRSMAGLSLPSRSRMRKVAQLAGIGGNHVLCGTRTERRAGSRAGPRPAEVRLPLDGIRRRSYDSACLNCTIWRFRAVLSLQPRPRPRMPMNTGLPASQ